MRRAVFLDRDGVINVRAPEGQYVTSWEEFHFLPQVAAAIALLNEAHFTAIVVSNQRCVAKGLIAQEDLEVMHQRMVHHLSGAKARIEAVYYCPHDNEPRCTCRKPAPGMLIWAAKEHSLDLSESWMVGDSDIDIAAGKSAGCRTVRIVSPGLPPKVAAELTAVSLYDAARKLTSI